MEDKLLTDSQKINRLQKLKDDYSVNTNISLDDYIFYCEELTTDKEALLDNFNDKLNVSDPVSGNGTYKLKVNYTLTQGKLELISLLKLCNYKTPVYRKTEILEELFTHCNSKKGHWAYISENYSARAINQVLAFMIKQYGNWTTLSNPAAKFTSLIKHRKRRKK